MVHRWSVVLVAITVAAALTGCSSDEAPDDPTTAAPTPLAQLDATSLRVVRGDFCDRVPDVAVRRALGGDPATDESWGNGDPVPGASGSGDIGHEIGCGWTGDDGSAVRAWVFARPVTRTFAATLVRRAGRHAGCTATVTEAFGTPAVLQTCTSPTGTHRLRRAGLFADTWVTCEVSGSAADLRTRLDDWCAQVVHALDAT